VNWLSIDPRGSISMGGLLDSLLTALGALERLRAGPMSDDANKFSLWDNESIWQLAMDTAPSDLVAVCQSGSPRPLPFSD
jgi:hypothetical protein